MNVVLSTGEKKRSLFRIFKDWLLNLLRLTDEPVIRLYTGYGNKTHCFLYGHVLSFSPLPRLTYRNRFLLNAVSLLRLFMVKPMRFVTVELNWRGKIITTKTASDGFFRFEWEPGELLPVGSHEVTVSLEQKNNPAISVSATVTIIIPHNTRFAFISDIDDTFLVSHSSNMRKRLFVLLSENARSRNTFEGVVDHYQFLRAAGTTGDATNLFIYISSSEWNLYEYIREFSFHHKLPEGVYLLNQLKLFKDVFKTGQNNHKTKFMRISRVLEAYPEQQFVLFGDDSQEDPFIYAAIADHFKKQVFCIYIRCVGKKQKSVVQEALKKIENAGIFNCYFRHSNEALSHSRLIGLL